MSREENGINIVILILHRLYGSSGSETCKKFAISWDINSMLQNAQNRKFSLILGIPWLFSGSAFCIFAIHLVASSCSQPLFSSSLSHSGMSSIHSPHIYLPWWWPVSLFFGNWIQQMSIASPFPVYLYTKFSQFYNLINGLQSDLAWNYIPSCKLC